jgi:hypothetical protein
MACIITHYVRLCWGAPQLITFIVGFDCLYIEFCRSLFVIFLLIVAMWLFFLFVVLLRYKPPIIPYGIFKLSNRYLKYVKLRHMFIQVNMVILTFTMNSVFVLRTGTYIKWVHNRSKTSPSILTRIRCAGIASHRTY